jgi:pyruvate dehydrogenase E2 component (dihydrolipoamide acetyltransferase)
VRFLVNEGERVNVGAPIIEIEIESDADKTEEGGVAEESVEARSVKPQAVSEPKKPSETPRRIVRAPPSVRKLARELDIDLSLVEGTGPGGVITREDVLRFAESQKRVETPKARAEEIIKEEVPPTERVERVPLKGIRKIMADRMVQAKSRIPHAYIVEEVDVTELLAVRDQLAKLAENSNIRLTLLPFIVKAVVKALKKYPLMNSSLDDDRGEIIVKKYYNIGIAVDTEMGLVVPNIKDADRKGLFQIAREIGELAKKAREGKLGLNDVRDGTFTITNIGSIGTVIGMPVINPPEAAILGVHRIVVKPMYVDGEIKPRKVVNLSLSFDHRIIEGAYAARFLALVKRYLEDPILLFASENEFEV